MVKGCGRCREGWTKAWDLVDSWVPWMVLSEIILGTMFMWIHEESRLERAEGTV